MITYRASRSGNLQAAYLGTCRVGYVERRHNDRWLWQLSIVMPGGGYGIGVVDDEVHAKEELTRSLDYWLASAGLTHAHDRWSSGDFHFRLAPQRQRTDC